MIRSLRLMMLFYWFSFWHKAGLLQSVLLLLVCFVADGLLWEQMHHMLMKLKLVEMMTASLLLQKGTRNNRYGTVVRYKVQVMMCDVLCFSGARSFRKMKNETTNVLKIPT